MKTKLLGSILAIAFGLFACAAPAEDDDPPAPSEETTEETGSELRIGGGLGAGCALTCSGGNQTCCCDVGEKCESGATYCMCKPANDPRLSPVTIGRLAAP